MQSGKTLYETIELHRTNKEVKYHKKSIIETKKYYIYKTKKI